MSSILPELLTEFEEKISAFRHGGITRKIDFHEMKNKICVAIGMRRTGKTYFLYQKICTLLDKKIPLTRILYVNFEDDRLSPFKQKNLREIIDGFYSLYPENHDHVCYLFLDEIQNIEDWEIVVRRYFDTKKVQIYLSGSSANLLSKEIATSLRGRSIATEIWPYSFTEYLTAKNLTIDSKLMGKKTKDQLNSYLASYLNQGGFPEVVDADHPDRIRTLQEYVNVVIFRDIVERYGITNISLIKYMIKSLLKNTGSGFTVNKFFNDLRSQGFSVSKMTIHEYLSYIEDVYLIFSVPLYSDSIRKIQTNPKKIYAIDTGLVNAYTTNFSNNFGHLFENMIYIDLRRKYEEVYYYLTKNRYEIDFLAKDIYGKPHLYQVVWDMNDAETIARETRALHEAEQELGIKGKIITPEYYLSHY